MDYLISFRRLVFTQVLLSIVAFCLAEPQPNIGLLLIAGSIGALSWYVTEGPRRWTMPRWMSTLAALGAAGWLGMEVLVNHAYVILAMGHFILWLQIILLYSPKTNRDYGQLLVLSLLQMIGACVMSVSMLFGLLLVLYSVLALVTVVLFQIKVTADHVHEANKRAAVGNELVLRPKPVTGRGFRRQFQIHTSMVGVCSLLVAASLFVLLPRSEHELNLPFDASRHVSQAGFTQQVRLGTSPMLGGSKEPVLNLTVTQDGQNVGSANRSWLLRGAALDQYDMQRRLWSRSQSLNALDHPLVVDKEGLSLLDAPADVHRITMDGQIVLRQSGHSILFSPHPIVSVAGDNLRKLTFNPLDQQLQVPDHTAGATVYRVRWTEVPRGADHLLYDRSVQHLLTDQTAAHTSEQLANRWDQYARDWQVQASRIRNYTLSILHDHGLDRDPQVEHTAHDAQIVHALANYLRDHYEYSLTPRTYRRDQEPLIEFLFHHRSGHCEMYAAALAAMTRSIGLRSRVITGYRAGEFNNIGGYYVVRQQHAHAWTEVYCGPEHGWRVFDATPPELVDEEHGSQPTWFSPLRELYEYLEFAWLRYVVAYDEHQREELISGMQESFTALTEDEEAFFSRVIALFNELPTDWGLETINVGLAVFIMFMIAVACASLAQTLLVRRRRLAALQLDVLKPSQRRGMVGKLRFYLMMLNMLERRGHLRPSWQSPAAFAAELAEQDPQRFAPVVDLTEMFYEIRFGHRDLSTGRRLKIKHLLSELEQALTANT